MTFQEFGANDTTTNEESTTGLHLKLPRYIQQVL